jgi:hypothetical protein
MKKITVFLALLFLSVSCSEYEIDPVSTTATEASRPRPFDPRIDPSKLTKVIIFPGQTYEKRLYFYPNGLLKSVANRFGTTYQTYIYDGNNNLTQVIASHPYTFTYDAENKLTSCNGQPVIYEAATNKYVYHYEPIFPNDPECPDCFDYPERREITLNSERLLTSDHTYYTSNDGDYVLHGIIAGYFDTGNVGNLAYVSNWNDPSGPSYNYDNKVNPLKAAMLPVCRAMSVSNESYSGRFISGTYCSANNVVLNGYGQSDPESEVYEITYNANNLPVSITMKNYYFETLEATRLFALYYYQN